MDSNHVHVRVVFSDLFDNLEKKPFDWIIINPPYYARKPGSERDLAWYCGENFEYFRKLFASLRDYTHGSSETVMVLTKGADLETIERIANEHNYHLQLLKENRVFFDERDFLFRIKNQVN